MYYVCIIIQAPSWLRGSAEASLSNQCKRYKLYRKFWSLLGQLGVWNDPVYLQFKQTKTSLNDPRDVMPNCVLTVSTMLLFIIIILLNRKYSKGFLIQLEYRILTLSHHHTLLTNNLVIIIIYIHI